MKLLSKSESSFLRSDTNIDRQSGQIIPDRFFNRLFSCKDTAAVNEIRYAHK